MASHRFSCEFMELYIFFGVESVNTFPISTLLPGVLSGKTARKKNASRKFVALNFELGQA